MTAPHAYLWARHRAAHHLQAEILETVPVLGGGTLPTKFRVRQVFGSTSGLAPGDTFETGVKVYTGTAYPVPAAGSWLAEGRYARGNIFELFLDRDLAIAGDGAELHPVAEATDHPTIPRPTREQAEREEARFRERFPGST